MYAVHKDMRNPERPSIMCPGCGNSIIMNTTLQAMATLGITREQVVLVTGAGCSSQVGDIFQFDWIHAPHGRVLPVATGLKIVRPELHVLAFMGDGDCASIGGNHLIHAARRNIGVIAVVFNNLNYGRTGGQVAPTTPHGAISTTSPYGNVERPFDLCALARAAGATYVARWTALTYGHLQRSLEKAFVRKGFSFIEVIIPCPTNYGRRELRTNDPADNLLWIARNTITRERADTLPARRWQGRFVVGEFAEDDSVPEFSQELIRLHG